MRGADIHQETLFSAVIPEQRVPKNHPLRPIREMVNEALASLKSYRPKDEDKPPTQGGGRNPSVDFRGEKRRRETHESKTDPDALLFRKSSGTTAKLSYMGHVLMENRNGLGVQAVNDERTTRHEGYRVSQTKRKRVEECFGC